jgi:hypothetical protein
VVTIGSGDVECFIDSWRGEFLTVYEFRDRFTGAIVIAFNDAGTTGDSEDIDSSYPRKDGNQGS